MTQPGGGSPYLGFRTSIGFLDPANRVTPGAWTVLFTPETMSIPDDYEVRHIALRGPGGDFEVWVDDHFYSASPRGDINEYDPKNPMPVRRGESIYFYFSRATGIRPTVLVYAYRPPWS